MNKLARFLGATLLCALPALPAAALDGGAVDPNTDPTFAGVGSLSRSTGGTFSGVLIGSRYVLTAQHVVGASASPAQWTFNLNLDGLALGERTFAVTRIVAAPGFVGFVNGEVARNDLTVLELDHDVPAGIPIYGLSDSPLQLGQEITLVGYGGTGPALKRRGTNIVEFLDPAPGPGANADVFAYDYDTDSANQATVVGGDSGSPVFVNEGGVWKLAAISTFSWTNPEVPGTGPVRGGGGMIVSAYAPWIQQATVVPEPATHALFAIGMLMLVACVRAMTLRRFPSATPRPAREIFRRAQNRMTETPRAR